MAAKSSGAKSPARPQIHYRDAGTGQYMPKEYADKHPKTTVKETDRAK